VRAALHDTGSAQLVQQHFADAGHALEHTQLARSAMAFIAWDERLGNTTRISVAWFSAMHSEDEKNLPLLATAT
jgi:hypothetical protein